MEHTSYKHNEYVVNFLRTFDVVVHKAKRKNLTITYEMLSNNRDIYEHLEKLENMHDITLRTKSLSNNKKDAQYKYSISVSIIVPSKDILVDNFENNSYFSKFLREQGITDTQDTGKLIQWLCDQVTNLVIYNRNHKNHEYKKRYYKYKERLVTFLNCIGYKPTIVSRHRVFNRGKEAHLMYTFTFNIEGKVYEFNLLPNTFLPDKFPPITHLEELWIKPAPQDYDVNYIDGINRSDFFSKLMDEKGWIESEFFHKTDVENLQYSMFY